MRGPIAKNVMITIGDYINEEMWQTIYLNVRASRVRMICFGCKLKGRSDEND